MWRFAGDGQRPKITMGGDKESAPRRFISAKRLHPYETILHDVGTADALFRGGFIQRVEQIDGAESYAVYQNGRARFKTNFDFLGLVRRFLRRGDPLPHGLVRCVGGIFELAAFLAKVPGVAVAAADGFLALLHGDFVGFGVSDGVLARIDVPFAPRRNDLQMGRNRFVGELEANLIVALAGAAMREAVSAKFQRKFRLALCQHGPRHGSAEEIRVFLDRARAERWPNVIAHKLFTQVFNICGGSSCRKRLTAL